MDTTVCSQNQADTRRFRVVVVGGGRAGIEAALALQALAGDRVQTTVLHPGHEFVAGPDPLIEGGLPAGPARCDFPAVLARADIAHVDDELLWLDHRGREIHTSENRVLRYDAVLFALEPESHQRFPYTVTIDPSRRLAGLRCVLDDIANGAVTSIAFVVPRGRHWPLPVYELALRAADRAAEAGACPDIRIVTAEHMPLGMFGTRASRAVAELLDDNRITALTDATARIRAAGHITARGLPGGLRTDVIAALPDLSGPPIAGLRASASQGFITTDPAGRVSGLQAVFAAGDVTDYPVKHETVAAQHAVHVARAIAVQAGARIPAKPFKPVIDATLRGAFGSLYLRARLMAGGPVTSEVSDLPLVEVADLPLSRGAVAYV